MYEKVWEYAFTERLRVSAEEYPLMFVEPTQNTVEQRAKQAELAFEKFKVPAFYTSRAGVLSSFAAGRSTALVVDIGASTTTVSPIYDGYVVKKGIQSQALAGNALTEQLWQLLEGSLKIPVVPQFKVLRKKQVDEGVPADFAMRKLSNTTKSFEQMAIKQTIDDFKETVCAVSDFRFDEQYERYYYYYLIITL